MHESAIYNHTQWALIGVIIGLCVVLAIRQYRRERTNPQGSEQ